MGGKFQGGGILMQVMPYFKMVGGGETFFKKNLEAIAKF
jgi:hypothetical protein